jgi:large subunit ribosomal protein L25
VKTQGGVVSHMRADVEVICLPKDLPDFLELDLSNMNLNETRFLGDIPVPEGVTIPELAQRNAPVVSIHSPRAEEPEAVAAEAAAAAPAEGAAPAAAPAAAAAAGEAKKGEEKKGDEKKDAAAPKKEAGGAKKEGGKK